MIVRRTIPTLVLAAIVLLSTTAVMSAQANDRLRLAQTYERTGDNRGAARLFQELYAERPDNDTYYEGVVRTLGALQQFQALIPIVEEHLRRRPSLADAMSLGGLYWRAGNTSQAERTWAEAAVLGKGTADVYASLAYEQARVLATPLAIASFRAARAALGTTDAYAAELTALLTAAGRLDEAVSEAMLDYRATGDQSRVQAALATIMASAGGPAIVATALGSDSDPEILRLRIWYARETRNWEQAFALARTLDEMQGGKGGDLLAFADRARSEGQYAIALSAYDVLIQSSTTSDQHRQNALYWSVRTLDQRLRQNAVPSAEQANDVLKRYDDIVQKYRSLWFVSDALYNMAVVADEALGDRDRARDYLQRLVNAYRGTTAAADGVLLLAELYLVEGREDVALSTLAQLSGKQPNADLTIRADIAQVRRADILWWQGALDSALAIYRTVALRPGSAAANDALDRIFVMQITDRDSALLATLAAAERFRASRAYDKAADRFAAAATATKDEELRDRCFWMAAESFRRAKRPSDAERFADSVLANVPTSIYGDRALVMKADFQEARGDRAAAIATLTSLLELYPRSILVPDARDRVRRLRGDA